MAVRPVVLLPDACLTKVAVPVAVVDDEAKALAQDLIDTMRSRTACVGLAAPQLGVSRRAFVIDVSGHRKAKICHGELVLFDPEIVDVGAPDLAREGCLSVPDFTGDVPRAATLTVRGLDLSGSERIVETDAFEARAVLHEIDHLDGLLFLDRVSSPQAVFQRKVYR
ncbi:MAG TPA: peptide deformylase [Acidimicrobiales bacterium]|nr:peptide deformylase [Acidimicrobiales bacterium]